MKQIISTPNAPKAIGPYSQAVRAGDFLYLSGQIPLSPATMKVESNSIEDQTRQVFVNIKAILSEAGFALKNLVKMTVLLADINDFQKVNEIYQQYFDNDYPARAAYQVSNLPLGVKIEIESIAYADV